MSYQSMYVLVRTQGVWQHPKAGKRPLKNQTHQGVIPASQCASGTVRIRPITKEIQAVLTGYENRSEAGNSELKVEEEKAVLKSNPH